MKKDVVIFDVPVAYLNAYIPEDNHLLIKFDDKSVDTMSEVDPELVKGVRFERGKKMLHLKIKNLYTDAWSLLYICTVYF